MMRRRRRFIDEIIQCSGGVGGRRAKGRRTAWLIGRGGQVGHVVDVGLGVDVLVHVMVVVGIVGIVVVMFTDGGVGAVDGESAVFVRDAHGECGGWAGRVYVCAPGLAGVCKKRERELGSGSLTSCFLRPGGSRVSLVPAIKVMTENIVGMFYLK